MPIENLDHNKLSQNLNFQKCTYINLETISNFSI
jgi:hypothetical protein